MLKVTGSQSAKHMKAIMWPASVMQSVMCPASNLYSVLSLDSDYFNLIDKWYMPCLLCYL